MLQIKFSKNNYKVLHCGLAHGLSLSFLRRKLEMENEDWFDLVGQKIISYFEP